MACGSMRKKVIMTTEIQGELFVEPQRHKEVNQYNEEEGERIRNEVSKTDVPEDYCPSPAKLQKIAANMLDNLLGVVRAMVSCRHSRPVYVGAITWCGACGAIRQPKPTPISGVPIADGDWEVPGLVGRM
jgi:hypothetical protein